SSSSSEASSRRAVISRAGKGRLHVRTWIAIAATVLGVLCLPIILAAQERPNVPPAGRGAAPANYPPYTRPVSAFVPPRTADGRVLCLAPGAPRSTIPAPVVGYQILQKPGYVVIFYEQNHLYRTIPLDGRPPLDPSIRKAMGVSRGHWEGNVLVVEVTNFTNN